MNGGQKPWAHRPEYAISHYDLRIMAKAHQRSIVMLFIVYAAAYLLVAAASFNARPALHNAIRGLALYSSAEVADPVYVSGLRLACQPARTANALETCVFRIGQDDLVVQATRIEVETSLERDCSARFRSAVPNCIHMMNRSQVPGFAYVNLTELASQSELAQLRSRHWFENLDEESIVMVILGFALGAGLIAAYALLPVLWPVFASKLLAFAITAAAMLAVTWATGVVSLVFIGGGYVD